MSEADAKPMMPIVLSGAIGALALADAFAITGDTDDVVKIIVGVGALAVSAPVSYTHLTLPTRS